MFYMNLSKEAEALMDRSWKERATAATLYTEALAKELHAISNGFSHDDTGSYYWDNWGFDEPDVGWMIRLIPPGEA